MKRQISDEQLDTLMRHLMNDASLDDTTVNEIADSPTVWWGVSRRINAGKDATHSPWPPVGNLWRWLIAGGSTAIMAAVVISFFVFRPADNGNVDIVFTNANASDNKAEQPPVNDPKVTKVEETSKILAADNKRKTVPAAKTIVAKTARIPTAETAVTKKSNEIKSEFIALSYARSPESGQIVRVKVPRSIMVTLGLVAVVEKPSSLVDAEVLVGDDGLTRAIRFIR